MKYVQTSSSICNGLNNGGVNMALGELKKYRVFLRLSLMTQCWETFIRNGEQAI